MGKLNEILDQNKKVVSSLAMLILIIILIWIFIYFRQNVEWIKMNPCDYCMNKTKFTCNYYDNSLYGGSGQKINLSLEEINQLNRGNRSILTTPNS